MRIAAVRSQPDTPRIILLAVALAALAVVLLIGFAQPVAQWGAGQALSAFGVNARYGTLHIGWDHTHAENVTLTSKSGEPIGTIASLDLGYTVRDALPGGARQFGLRSVEVSHPHIIVIRHKDGTYNIPIPKSNGSSTASTTPLIFTGAVHDGSIDIYDGAQGVPAARHLIVREINASADVASNADIVYEGSLRYVEDGNAFPVRASGHIDTIAKFGTQSITAAHLPIARIVDFAANSPSFHMLGGELQNVRALAVAAPGTDGSLQQHYDIAADLAKTRIAIGGLVKPLRDVHGHIAAYENALLMQNVRGTLADAPVRIDGGIYDLAHPQFRLTVAAIGDLAQLRQALAQTNRLPVAGNARVDALVEGPLSHSVTLIALHSAAPRYATEGFGQTSTSIAFDGQEMDLVGFHSSYDGLAVSGRGRVLLHSQHAALQVLGTVAGNAANVPYASALLPSMPLGGDILATGDTLARVATRGVLYGAGNGASLNGAFAFSSDGTGVAGPLRVRRDGGSLYAIAAIDHPHDNVTGYLDATRMPLAYNGTSATLDGRVTASYVRGQLAAAGLTHLAGLHTPMGSVREATLHFGRTADAPLEVALDASGIGALDAVASAMLTYRDGRVDVRDAAVASRSTFADANGTVANVTSGAPVYDMNAHVHSADITALAALAAPQRANLVEGSATANVHVSGAGSAPNVDGDVAVGEGAVNGLPFSGLHATIAGAPASMRVRDGAVHVGRTVVGFSGAYAGSGGSIAIDAPSAHLDDFNDFFDQGDMLGGDGRLAAQASFSGSGVANTSGNAHIANARVRSFVLGTADARWATRGRAIDTSLAFGGSHGTVRANGLVALNGGLQMRAHARAMDLGFWLPMAGLNDPITGIADVDGSVAGRYPALDAQVAANVQHASAYGVRVSRAAARATLARGNGRLQSLDVQMPHAHITGGGTFGLAANAPLNLSVRGVTANVADVAYDVSGRRPDAAGALDTTVLLQGTRTHPVVTDSFTLTQAHYGAMQLPRAVGTVAATQSLLQLRGAEFDLTRGRILANASVPVTLTPFAIDPHDRPIAASVVADDVDAVNVLPLLPKGTRLSGRLDGRVAVAGSVRAPQLSGGLDVAQGSYSGPFDRVPVTNASARVAFAGETATLQRAHANLGAGTVDARGTAAIPSVADARDVRAQLHADIRNARVDAPAYLKGTIDGSIDATKNAGADPVLGGTIAISHARIPVTALYNPAPADAPKTTPPALGLNLHVVADNDVRVVSPNVDVGAVGSVDVLNTLADPQLEGQFSATDGTVSFYRTFAIQNATVNFHREDGVIPTVDALATTTITDPQTDVALRVTGPATGLNVAFASDPAYDRAQILGLLVNAQALGAVDGVAASGPSTPFSASSAITGLAAGQLDTLFTRSLLEPLGTALGKTLGFSSFSLTDSITDPTQFGLNARRSFGKHLSFVFAETFGEPRLETYKVEDLPNASGTAYALTVYNSTATRSPLGMSRPVLVNALDYGNAATLPSTLGTNGFDLRYERKFP